METNRVNERMRRIVMMSGGVLCIGIGSGLFRYAGFGADPFTTMNLGISALLGMSFGTWQLVMNLLLFVPVLIWGRKTIGIGTVANMVLVGYISDFCQQIANGILPATGFGFRLAVMAVALILASFGVACYIVPSLGVAPYDATQLMIEQYSHQKISYRTARITTDALCIAAGIVSIITINGDLQSLIGIGTICNVLMMGPVIQFFKDKLTGSRLQTAFQGSQA